MGRVKLDFHYDGFNEVRRDPKVAADIEDRANAIAGAAGDGYEVRTSSSRSRARAIVITATPEAMVDQARNHTLERSIDAGR